MARLTAQQREITEELSRLGDKDDVAELHFKRDVYSRLAVLALNERRTGDARRWAHVATTAQHILSAAERRVMVKTGARR